MILDIIVDRYKYICSKFLYDRFKNRNVRQYFVSNN